MVNNNTLICNLRRNNKLIPSRGMTIPFFKNLTQSYLKRDWNSLPIEVSLAKSINCSKMKL